MFTWERFTLLDRDRMETFLILSALGQELFSFRGELEQDQRTDKRIQRSRAEVRGISPGEQGHGSDLLQESIKVRTPPQNQRRENIPGSWALKPQSSCKAPEHPTHVVPHQHVLCFTFLEPERKQTHKLLQFYNELIELGQDRFTPLL